jgi:hypothetical protein
MTAIKVQVEYVGKKPFVVDNVAKSGKTWEGAGAVQEVTPAQAKILIGYADQWALAAGQDASVLSLPTVVVTKDEHGNEVETDASELTGHVEKMTATQLVAYAQNKYGKTLKLNRGRKVLLDEVMVLEGHINVD